MKAMKTTLLLIIATFLTACAGMETHSGPFVNEPALHQLGGTLRSKSEYERQGYPPGDAWEAARFRNFGGPLSPVGGGITPLAGYGWGVGSR